MSMAGHEEPGTALGNCTEQETGVATVQSMQSYKCVVVGDGAVGSKSPSVIKNLTV